MLTPTPPLGPTSAPLFAPAIGTGVFVRILTPLPGEDSGGSIAEVLGREWVPAGKGARDEYLLVVLAGGRQALVRESACEDVRETPLPLPAGRSGGNSRPPSSAQ